MNLKGQATLDFSKQKAIEEVIRRGNYDIVMMQEIDTKPETFENCDYISSNYTIYSNNARTGYGTATLVSASLTVESERYDEEGRVILLEIGELTVCNVYLPSGTDNRSRSKRDKYCAEILPRLLTNCKPLGLCAGDWNCIVHNRDASNHPNAKISNTLQRLIKLGRWRDCYREQYPEGQEYSRFYQKGTIKGASRIDRAYQWGEGEVTNSRHISLSFSDHHALEWSVKLPGLEKIKNPRARPRFKISDEVVEDEEFRKRLMIGMESWERIRNFGSMTETLRWWDRIVKPGIKKIGRERAIEIHQEQRGELDLLMMHQRYFNHKLQAGDKTKLGPLKLANARITEHYQKVCQTYKTQSRVHEFQERENVSIYHHELHRKVIKRSAILKLDTEKGILEGHDACARYLEDSVEELLENKAQLDPAAQEILLREVRPVFTEEDNAELRKTPTNREIHETLLKSNTKAAPGTDGLTSLFYLKHWDIVGDALCDVIRDIFARKEIPVAMKVSIMVFGSKPKKAGSILPKDKRKISLLNADFKLATGVEARRLGNTTGHTLSHLQLVAGNRRPHHGIDRARDAIQATRKRGHRGCGILDTDLVAAFDFLCMQWVYEVLRRKGLHEEVISRYHNLYDRAATIVSINNIQGRSFRNIRKSLRQGDLPSMHFFAYGIDPLLHLLERKLIGIPIFSRPVQGPCLKDGSSPQPLVETFKLVAYADDVKPAITTMEEFGLVDRAMAWFENASGCRLHRNPSSGKCKFLPLARWRGTLQQEDIPSYMTISSHIDMLGVQLTALSSTTLKQNGDISVQRAENTTRQWRTGKNMPLSMRSWSLNTYCLSKIWYKTKSVPLGKCQISKIVSAIKKWIYQDLFIKPEEQILFRSRAAGGLGVMDVASKSLAGMARTFMETAANPEFSHRLDHSTMYEYHVLGNRDIPDPGYTPYYQEDFFALLRDIWEEKGSTVEKMNEKSWYGAIYARKNLEVIADGERAPRPCRAERQDPGADWEGRWPILNTRGLGPANTSFLIKMAHDLLPTTERLDNTKRNADITATGKCKVPECRGATDDREHSLFYCHTNNGVGERILEGMRESIPGITADDILKMKIECNPEEKPSLVWLMTEALRTLWQAKMEKLTITSEEIRTSVEANLTLLQETKLKSLAEGVGAIVANFF